MTETKNKIGFWALKAFLVILFLLGPGIRGYQNWQIHEYLLFVALPIFGIVFCWKKDDIQKHNAEELA